MKNSFIILTLLVTASFCNSQPIQSPWKVTGQPIEHPGRQPAIKLLPVITLTEDQAENSENPISVPLGSTICVELCGDKTISQVYSSGSGSCWGHYWLWDNEENDVLSLRQCPAFPAFHKNGEFIHHDEQLNKAGTTQTVGKWIFDTKTIGLATVTFKQYYYSNATIRNLDGSSPWKDPIQEIHFTINVVDPANE